MPPNIEELIDKITNALGDVSISVSHFQRPSCDFFRSLMSRIMEEFYVEIGHLLTYNLHEHSSSIVDGDLIPNLNFLAAINYVFPFIQIRLFDIIFPTPARTYEIFNAAIDFYIFCDDQLGLMGDCVEEYQMKQAQLQKLQNEYRTNQGMLLQANSEKTKVEQLLYQEKQNVEIKNNELVSITELNKKLEKECKEKQGGVEKTEEQIRLLEKKITHTKKKIEDLERNFVNNPEMIVYQLDKLKEDFDELVKERNEIHQKLQETEAEAQEVKKRKPMLDELKKQAQQFSSVASNVEELKKKLLNIQKQIEESEIERRSSESAINLLVNDVTEIRQEIDLLKTGIKQKTDVSQNDNAQVKRELHSLEEDVGNKISHLSSKLEEINLELQQKEISIQKDIMDIVQTKKRYDNMLKNCRHY